MRATRSTRSSLGVAVLVLALLRCAPASEQQDARRFKRRSKSASQLPEFAAPIGNVSAVLGRDARLICTVDNLGQYQVAWLKEETRTILSIDTNIIITNYRIFLIPDEEERKWVLHIKDVQESDRGLYQCQINTKPTRSTSGYLEVVVPPKIVEAQSSQLVDTVERANVSLQCKATGHPRPTVSWRRDDGQPIRLVGRFEQRAPAPTSDDNQNSSSTSDAIRHPIASGARAELTDIRSDRLTLRDVDRSMAGVYVCAASNGIPSQTSKQIPVYVKFAPTTSVQSKRVVASLGQPLEIECAIEAFPRPRTHWSKKSVRLPLTHASLAAGWSRAKRERRALSGQPEEFLGAKFSRDDRLEELSDLLAANSTSAPHSHSIDRSRVDHEGANDNSDWSEPETQAPSRVFGSFRRLSSPLDLSSESTPALVATDAEQPSAAQPQPSTRASVSVKLISLSPHTYKLKMSIQRMHEEDFGEYTCVASNSMGESESSITLTRADRGDERTRARQPPPDSANQDEQLDYYQRDSLGSLAHKPYVQPPPAGQPKERERERTRAGTGTRVVYDENYLQAIRARQSNLGVPGKLQQRLKLTQPPERSRAGEVAPSAWTALLSLLLTCAIAATR